MAVMHLAGLVAYNAPLLKEVDLLEPPIFHIALGVTFQSCCENTIHIMKGPNNETICWLNLRLGSTLVSNKGGLL
jgi:hypothetical protein